MLKKLKILFLFVVIILLFLTYYFFIALAPKAEHITFGIDFSKEYAILLGLDWKKAYVAMLSDLKVRNIKLLNQWDVIESEKDVFNFQDADWQLLKAKSYGAEVIYVVGMKTGRWPECHIPSWADSLSKEQQQDAVLQYVKTTILRYKDDASIVAWQAENEPFYSFGVCPWYDDDFVKKEVALIKSIDPEKPVIISDSGEQSLWFKAAKVGDIVGTTMYRKVWVHLPAGYGFYIDYPLPAVAYFNKAQIIQAIYGKKVINVELQAEPWVSSISADSLVKQQESMNVNQFKKNIEYAKESGLDTFYFWGYEWWYYMKEKQDSPEIWNEAKNYFK